MYSDTWRDPREQMWGICAESTGRPQGRALQIDGCSTESNYLILENQCFTPYFYRWAVFLRSALGIKVNLAFCVFLWEPRKFQRQKHETLAQG